MSLVITGSVSGTIVSGKGASLVGTYVSGETLTVSTLSSTGKYMFQGSIDGFGSCTFSTYGFTRAYGSSFSSAADVSVTTPTASGTVVTIQSLRANSYSSGVRRRSASA
jgi:hypothetical protein